MHDKRHALGKQPKTFSHGLTVIRVMATLSKDRLLPSLRPNSALTGPCRSGRVDIPLSEVGRQCTTKGMAHQKAHLRQIRQSCAQSHLEPIPDIGSKHRKEDFWT